MHPLAAKIVDLRRRLVWRERAAAACAIWAAVAAAAGTLTLVDYLFRVSDRGLRVMMTAALAAASGYAIYRWWYVPRGGRHMGTLAVARRVEAQFPELHDRLASALEFLEQSANDATAGSAALRRAVVVEAEQTVFELPLEAVIDRRPLRRAGVWAGIALATLVACAMFAGGSVWTAATRLLAPLGTTEWPRTNHLEFRDPPLRIAVGQAFEAELVDTGGVLLDDVQIQYRNVDGSHREIQSERMNRVGDAMVARRSDVQKSFEFRADGGDDHSMPWATVEAVDPPKLDSLTIIAHPPAYAALPATAAERHLEVLAGTGIEVSGVANEALAAARIVGGETAITAILRPDGEGRERRGFVIPPETWIATKSGKYRLELESADGVPGTAVEGNLLVTPDAPPSVAWERPRDDLFVLSTATVPIEVAVKDNLAIASVELQYSRSDRPDAKMPAIEMYRGPEVATSAEGNAAQQQGESRNVKYDMALEPLMLSEGTQLALNVAASDYRPGSGKTALPRRVTIVSREQLDARLAGEQSRIAARLEESLKLQQEVRDDVHGLAIQLRDAGQLTAADQNTLSTAEQNQRRVGKSLAAPADGVAAQTGAMLDEMQMNGIVDGDLPRQMNDLRQNIATLAADPLPTAERELSSARKTADSKDKAGLAESLAAAGDNQDNAIAALREMLTGLSGAADFGQLVRDLDQLRADQLEQRKSTQAAVGLETATLELRELSRQQRATLNKAADGEEALARRYDRIEQTMSRLANELTQRDAAAAERVGDAIELARSLAISVLMRQVGQDLSGNRVGQALEGGTHVADSLQQLIDTLRDRSRLKPAELVSKLRAAEKELAALRGELAKARERLEQAEQQGAGGRPADPARDQQEQLQKEMAQLARELRQLQAAEAGKSTSRAAGNLDQKAGQAAKSGDAREAEKDLAKAARQLAERRARAEEDLFREFLQRFHAELQTMIDDQTKVIGQTTELNERLKNERLERDAAKAIQMALTDLAGKERELAAAAQDQAELLEGIHVIGVALAKAADRLKDAAWQLDQRQLDAPTQRAERQALVQLEQIAAALAQAKQAAGEPQNNAPPGNSDGGSNQPKRPVIELFEAKLLRSMQADLGERTHALQQEMAAANDANRAANAREADELAAEQGRLAELVRELRTRDNGSDEQQP